MQCIHQIFVTIKDEVVYSNFGVARVCCWSIVFIEKVRVCEFCMADTNS